MVSAFQKWFTPPTYAKHEDELRQVLFRQILGGATFLVDIYLVLGAAGVGGSYFFPYDGLIFLVLCALCWGLQQAKQVPFAASWFVAGVNILATFEAQAYGLAHPAAALYLVGIITAGMLIGGWFLRLWTGLGLFFVGMLAYQELFERPPPAALHPLTTAEEALTVVSFWWLLFGLAGWLVWLFASHLERMVQIAQGQTRTLSRTLQATSAVTNFNELLAHLLASITEELNAQWSGLYLYIPAGQELRFTLGYAQNQLVTPLPNSPATPAASFADWPTLQQSQKPVIVTTNQPAALPQQPDHSAGIHTILYVPLLQQGQLWGFFTIHTAAKRLFSAGELELAQALAQQLTLARELMQLGVQAQDQAVLEERNRMAREIHDSLAQGFTGIVVQLEAAEEMLEEGDLTEAQPHLTRAKTLARHSLQEARRSVWALRPAALTNQNLPAALRDMVQKLTGGIALQSQVIEQGVSFTLRPEIEETLLRIAQEAVNNVLKHAQASQLTLTLTYLAPAVTLCVKDNGRGLGEKSGRGFGLLSMQERAERCGGRLEIRQPAGGGTEIFCEVQHGQ